MRDRVDGKKETLQTFKFDRDARQYARHIGSPEAFGIGVYEAIERLQESMGGRRKRLTPRLQDYARELLVTLDPNHLRLRASGVPVSAGHD